MSTSNNRATAAAAAAATAAASEVEPGSKQISTSGERVKKAVLAIQNNLKSNISTSNNEAVASIVPVAAVPAAATTDPTGKVSEHSSTGAKKSDPRETIGGIPANKTQTATECNDEQLQQLQDRVNRITLGPLVVTPSPSLPRPTSTTGVNTRSSTTMQLSRMQQPTCTPNQTGDQNMTSQTAIQNVTITAGVDQSYDYYMEAGAALTAAQDSRQRQPTELLQTSMNGGNNDTFENLWLDDDNNNDINSSHIFQDNASNASYTNILQIDDEEDNFTVGTDGTRCSAGTTGTGGGTIADDASLMSLRKMVWKANAVQAALAQQQQQQQLQQDGEGLSEQEVFRSRPRIAQVTPIPVELERAVATAPVKGEQATSPSDGGVENMSSPIVLNPPCVGAALVPKQEKSDISPLASVLPPSTTPSAALLISEAWQPYNSRNTKDTYATTSVGDGTDTGNFSALKASACETPSPIGQREDRGVAFNNDSGNTLQATEHLTCNTSGNANATRSQFEDSMHNASDLDVFKTTIEGSPTLLAAPTSGPDQSKDARNRTPDNANDSSVPFRERTNESSSSTLVKSPSTDAAFKSPTSNTYINSISSTLAASGDYLSIKRNASSPPDPPSQQFIPNSQLKRYAWEHSPEKKKKMKEQKQQTSQKYRVPNAVPGESHYDPEDEDDGLTNLVITVMGVEDKGKGAYKNGVSTSETKLHPPSFIQEQDNYEDGEQREAFLNEEDVEDISFVSRYDNEGLMVNTDGNLKGDIYVARDIGIVNNHHIAYSFETLFLIADETSGIFLATFLLLLVPLVLLGAILWELLDASSKPLHSWRNFFGIPTKEELSVEARVAQICLLLGWVLLVKQTALVNTMFQWLCLLTSRASARRCTNVQRQQRGGANYANMSYLTRNISQKASGHTSISKRRRLFGSTLDLAKHALYMVSAVVVLVQATDSVIMLLWNMTALEFVSRLDTLAFHVWTRGNHHMISSSSAAKTNGIFLHALATPSTIPSDGSPGAPQDETANVPANFRFTSPTQLSKQHLLRVFLYFIISGSILLFFGWIVYEQVLGYPPVSDCNALLLQFGELVDNGISTTNGATYYLASTFGGLYRRRKGEVTHHHGRFIYDMKTMSPLHSPKYKVAYCRPLEAWTIAKENADPCDEYVLRTGTTNVYDLLSLKKDESIHWFVSSRGEFESISHDTPLDWFEISCADCSVFSSLSGEGYGYHCAKFQPEQTPLISQSVASQAPPLFPKPCGTLAWDARLSPFPDVLTKLRLSSNDDESVSAMGGVEPDTMFEIMVDAYGAVLLEPQFQRPVYASRFESHLVLMIFAGRRWVVAMLRTSFDEWEKHPERHSDHVSNLWDYLKDPPASKSTLGQVASASPKTFPLYVSEVVDIAQSSNLSPVGLQWHTIRREQQQSLLGTSLVAGNAFDTALLCAICSDDTNPCHSSGICYRHDTQNDKDLESQCLCRPGYEGHLCESSLLGCGNDKLGLCHNDGECVSGMCSCPTWERNQKSFQIRGEFCEVLPNCFDFEMEGFDCFERGTCSNAGCENGSVCRMDGSCDCDSDPAEAGKYRGKLCQERINCFDFETEGEDCVTKGSCTNIACNGGICSSNGSCRECPPLATGHFCTILPDCYHAEMGGVESSCFETDQCTNAGCANGGQCQRDGSCTCPLLPSTQDGVGSTSKTRFSGKLCQIGPKKKTKEVTVSTTVSTPSMPTSPPSSTRLSEPESSSNRTCPEGLTGQDCSIPLDCWADEIGGQDCVVAKTCTNKACHSVTTNSTCLINGQCSCPEMFDVEVYGKLCHQVLPVDDCFEAEPEGRDCFKSNTCTNAGCSNGGQCTETGSCDCPNLFW